MTAEQNVVTIERIADEAGMELPDIQAAQEEAAQSLADLVRNKIRGRSVHAMAIEIRDHKGPVLEVSFLWRMVT